MTDMPIANPAPTIGETLALAARTRPDAPAYLAGDAACTWAGIDAAADRIAAGLLALGYRRGDRIGLIALNGIEWLQVFYGATRVGVAVVGLSVRYRDTEIAYMLADSEARGVVCAAQADGFDLLAMLDRLAPGLPALRDVIPLEATPGRPLDLPRLLAAQSDPAGLAAAGASVATDDLAMVIYTSGTTGRPKGAGLTHRSMLASAKAQADHTRVDATDLIQLALPLNHVGGITCGVLTHLLGGGVCDLVPVFKAETMLERIAAHPPTMLSGVPTMLTLLLAHPRIDTVDLGSVRLITTGGSNVDGTLLAQLQARMPGAAIMNLYGLSESSGALVMTPRDCTREQLMTSIGRPLADAELRVIDKDGTELPADAVGELCFRGVGVVPGYIGAAAGNDAFRADGWLRTGDLGEVDDAGFIRLRGRAKDMYIQGGYNVYPAEIEDLIARHPKVLMVAGIGVPDPVLGEIGRYYVVPKPGSGLTEREIVEHCAGRLADYKQPRQVVLRDELPLTPAGKIRKAALREEVGPPRAPGG